MIPPFIQAYRADYTGEWIVCLCQRKQWKQLTKKTKFAIYVHYLNKRNLMTNGTEEKFELYGGIPP